MNLFAKWILLVLVLVLMHPIPHLSAQEVGVLDSTLVLGGNTVKIGTILGIIDDKPSINVTYSPDQIDYNKKIRICKKPCSVLQYLKQIALVSNLELVINDGNVYLIKNYSNKKSNDFISLEGYVKDFETGEVLIGAAIFNSIKSKGRLTDENGFFFIDNINRDDSIKISYIGYSSLILAGEELSKSIKSTFYLHKSNILKDVIIDINSKKADFSYDKVNLFRSIYSVGESTTLLGSNDVLSDLTSKPGIEKLNDFQGGLSINGLSPDDNIYLLDGVRIFEPNHIFGLFSSFNRKPINKVSFYSNYIPSKYQNAFSAVINSHLIEGDYKKHNIDFDLSNSYIGLFLSGPIVKYKTSYFLDIRKSILNTYIPSLIKNKIEFNDLDFYDINFKVTQRIKMGAKASVFFYNGYDNIQINNSFENTKSSNNYHWGNFAYGLRGELLLKNSIRSEIVLFVSKYKNKSISSFEASGKQGDKNYLSIYSFTNIREIGFFNDFKKYSGKSVFVIGYKFSKYNLLPALKGEISNDLNNFNLSLESEEDRLYYNGMLHLSNEYNNSLFKLSTGLQVGYLFNSTYSKIYFNPSINIDFKITKNSYIGLSATKTSKFVHSLGSYSIGIPSMIWAFSDDKLPISYSYNYSTNYIFKRGNFMLKTDLYLKYLHNILLYKNIADIYNPVSSKGIVLPSLGLSKDYYENIVTGNGKGYGINISTLFKTVKYNLDLSFSINRTSLNFEKINKGYDFAGKYDLLYSSSAKFRYKLNRINLYLDWHLHSGQVFTLPRYIYKDNNGDEVLDYSTRNNMRMDLYNSVSLGIDYNKKIGKISYKISLGVSNIFNNFNPVYAYLFKKNSVFSVSQVSGIPIFPYFNLSLAL